MKQKIRNLLENKLVDNFLIALIILNFIVFIFQTDINFYNNFKTYINQFEFISIIIFTFEYFLRVFSLEKFKDLLRQIMVIDFLAVFPYYLSFVTINTVFLRMSNMKPIFVKTKNVKGFINLIHNLKNKPENITKIGLVYGNAGLGKTKTALYLSIQYDAIYVRATNSMSPKWLLEEIAKELDEIPRFYTADIFRQCVNALKSNLQIIITLHLNFQ